MAVRKIQGRWYVDLRIDGKRYRKVSPENTRISARVYEQELLRDIEQQTSRKQTGGKEYIDYQTFANDWYTTYVLTNNRPSVQRNTLYLSLEK